MQQAFCIALIIIFSSFSQTVFSNQNARTRIDKWLPPQPGLTRLILFYQKDCRQCHRQFIELDCLRSSGKFSILLIGVGKERLHLKKTALQHQLPYRLMSFQDAMKIGVNETPAWLLGQQNQWSYSKGFHSCKKLLSGLLI